MIDPIIFSFELGNLEIAFRWYGVLVVLGVLVGAWLTEKELIFRGAQSDWVWDGLLWVLPSAIIGARVWYVINNILGGDRGYLDDPVSIFRITDGGLHIFGAFIFGGLAAYFFAKRKKVDIWVLMDSAAPALLIGQAVARPANFINQELYGPPTSLPWGIQIPEIKRIHPYSDLSLFPLETTRFHPTFAYEMIWNILAAALILWLVHRFRDRTKPGMAFATWLLLAGIGRFIIEFFRPDQPQIPGTLLSYSIVIAGIMAVVGILWLLIRFNILKPSFISPGPEAYNVPKNKKWKK